jgi:hypothetical protein
MASKRNKPGEWHRLPHTWYRVMGGTEYWLPEPPQEGQVHYAAKNLFYKPTGCSNLNKNNMDCWSMLIVDGPKELLGQEIVWFNRTPDNAVEVPLEVADDIVEMYNSLGRQENEPEINIFDLNPELLSHPDFNEGLGVLPMDPSLPPGVAGGATQYGGNYYSNPMDHYDDHGWVTTGAGLHGGPEVPRQMGDSVQMPGARGRTSTTAGFSTPSVYTDEVFHGVKPNKMSKGKWLGVIAVGGAIAASMLNNPKKGRR